VDAMSVSITYAGFNKTRKQVTDTPERQECPLVGLSVVSRLMGKMLGRAFRCAADVAA
jgi:hypothetical protein